MQCARICLHCICSVQKWKHLRSRVVLIARWKCCMLKMSKWRHIMVVMRTSLTDYYRLCLRLFCCCCSVQSAHKITPRRKMCVSVNSVVQLHSFETDSPISNNWRENQCNVLYVTLDHTKKQHNAKQHANLKIIIVAFAALRATERQMIKTYAIPRAPSDVFIIVMEEKNIIPSFKMLQLQRFTMQCTANKITIFCSISLVTHFG